MKYINHIEPVEPRKAQHLVAEVYAEARSEMGRLPEPVIMLSPNPELMAAGWAALYETLLGGTAPRARKETVAAAVASSMRCPWCIDAHTTMLYAAGQSATAATILAGTDSTEAGDNGPYVEWARGTTASGGPPAPFGPEHAAEYIGTAVQFHFLIRLILVLLDETFLPGGPRAHNLLRRAAGRAFARNVRASHQPGLAAHRLPLRQLPDDLAWAAASPPVAAAFAAIADCLDQPEVLPEAVRDVVTDAVQTWHGDTQPMSSSWTTQHTDHLPEHLRPVTRLALLTALAPHQVTSADIDAARPQLPNDTALVTTLSWAAWIAARRVAGWITRPVTKAPTTG